MKFILSLTITAFLGSNYFFINPEKNFVIEQLEYIYSNPDGREKILANLNFQKKKTISLGLEEFEKNNISGSTSIIIKFKKKDIEEIDINSTDMNFIKSFLHSCDDSFYKDIGIETSDNGYFGIWKEKKLGKDGISNFYLGGIKNADSTNTRFIFKPS
jgi:hypothetical protein